MNKKEFCRDLAALINRYGIDANFETADGIEDGTQYPGMSYEDGIQQFWLWLTGETEEKPFEE